ncbi:D-xylulose kinase [Trametes versicolor FP-101664 SS1]|uniref:D-xylulose kinase n=1 Tax=Trametes versicolor (strain FP-101664) TaxID=717944 RepID=UPI0004622432|nr:D-xylulose kinase [Trametes versicolor FP-101664 SS1]EIW58198.1 D-xylulose kinase [Trametes versicolor FP-101664 SS1]
MSASVDDPLFLGLDLSTQGLKAVLIDEEGAPVHESAVHFDRDLPSYGTTNGAIRGPGAGEVTSPVCMWLDAYDLIMERMRAAGVDFSRIVGISGDGQQHGSVYWSSAAEELLASLDSTRPLSEQLAPAAFSIQRAPIWQDSSTTRECRELEDAVGGAQALADLTGSRAYERFTGTQIAKIRRTDPEAYHATARVSLVSSFMPSLFLGSIAPIEVSDASGMNLMNVLTCEWDDRLLEAAGGPELRAKIGPEPAPGGTFLGKISPYWVQRWGFNEDCSIAPFTGDNPATVVALSTPGDAILSLGTSTTLLLSIPPAETAPKRFTTSHLLSHPTTSDAHIAMLCYKNGALAREQVRDQHASGHWTRFNELVEARPVGNDGLMGFYFPLPEIIPPNVQGNHFFSTSPSVAAITESEMPEDAHPRAILESQFLSIRSRITAILPPDAPPLQRLVLSGGSSANPVIQQAAADVFGMRVFIAGKEGAAEGGAQLARYAWWREQNGGAGTFEEMRAMDGVGEAQRTRCVAEPKPERERVYAGLVETYRACEDAVVRACAAAVEA